jgi:hypothetical protein
VESQLILTAIRLFSRIGANGVASQEIRPPRGEIWIPMFLTGQHNDTTGRACYWAILERLEGKSSLEAQITYTRTITIGQRIEISDCSTQNTPGNSGIVLDNRHAAKFYCVSLDAAKRIELYGYFKIYRDIFSEGGDRSRG